MLQQRHLDVQEQQGHLLLFISWRRWAMPGTFFFYGKNWIHCAILKEYTKTKGPCTWDEVIRACMEIWGQPFYLQRLGVVCKPFNLLIPHLELLHRNNSKQIPMNPIMLESWNNKRWGENLKGINLQVSIGQYLIKSNGFFIYLLALVFLKSLHFASSHGVLFVF